MSSLTRLRVAKELCVPSGAEYIIIALVETVKMWLVWRLEDGKSIAGLGAAGAEEGTLSRRTTELGSDVGGMASTRPCLLLDPLRILFTQVCLCSSFRGGKIVGVVFGLCLFSTSTVRRGMTQSFTVGAIMRVLFVTY